MSDVPERKGPVHLNGDAAALFEALHRLEQGQRDQGRSIGGLRDDLRQTRADLHQVRDDVHQVRDQLDHQIDRLLELERRPPIPVHPAGLDTPAQVRVQARAESDQVENRVRIILALITLVGVLSTSVATVLTRGGT